MKLYELTIRSKSYPLTSNSRHYILAIDKIDFLKRMQKFTFTADSIVSFECISENGVIFTEEVLDRIK